VALATVLLVTALARPATAGAAPLQPCPDDRNCATLAIDVLSSGAPGDTVGAWIVYRQANNDQTAGGVDEIAVLTLTLGIPGLELADCSAPGPDGLNPSFVTLPGPLSYRVVVQNLTCEKRESCLCPSGSEPRDPYINLLLVGDVGAAGVQPLPSGNLLRLTFRVDPGPARQVPLHVYSAVDDATAFPAPEDGALLSMGDVRAVDRTVRTDGHTLNVRIADGELAITGADADELGNADGRRDGDRDIDCDDCHHRADTADCDGKRHRHAYHRAAERHRTETAPRRHPDRDRAIACIGDCDHSGVVTVNESSPVSASPRRVAAVEVSSFDCAATATSRSRASSPASTPPSPAAHRSERARRGRHGMTELLLSAAALGIRYGATVALDDVDLDLHRGEVRRRR
jgi:hypothetical protein